MKYAVNIADLTKDLILAQFLFQPMIKNRIIVDVERGMIDGKAVILEDCDEKKFEAIRDIVRKKYNKNEFRLYEWKKKRWVRK
ncbi:MAG: hypothetical protein DRO05_00645 [Thermoproteota archaeon]|nr:MAG: hypothetical protein DRO05_00645 [Candidatus Korarchaeota archaeon]